MTVEPYLEVFQCVEALPHTGERSPELTLAEGAHRNLRNSPEPLDDPEFTPHTRGERVAFLHGTKSLRSANSAPPNTKRRMPGYRGVPAGERSEEYLK